MTNMFRHEIHMFTSSSFKIQDDTFFCLLRVFTMNSRKSIRNITDCNSSLKFIIFYICFYVPIILIQRVGLVSFLGTNNDQCFLVSLSMLISFLDVTQTKSVGKSCCGLSKLYPTYFYENCYVRQTCTLHLKSARTDIL